MVLDRFNRKKSREFVKRGFEELSCKVGDDIIENYFDGIPGWLSLEIST